MDDKNSSSDQPIGENNTAKVPVPESSQNMQNAFSPPAPATTPVSSENVNISSTPTIGGQPTAGRKKKALAVFLVSLVAIAGIGFGTYALLSKTSDESVSSAGPVKKDVANLRFVSGTYGWDTFYPVSDNTSTYVEANLALFESLVRFENKTQLVPSLSTGWTNPDSSTWVFKIKPGVQFHTGREMTAEDVKLSLESEAVKNSVWGETFGNSIKSIEVSGPSQVTIKTDGPDPTLLKKLTNLHIYDTKADKEGDPVTGTGPYVVKQGTTPSETSLELVAFDNYHGGRVNVRSLSFIGTETPEEAIKLFDENKADITDSPQSGMTREHGSLTVEPNSVALLSLNSNKPGSPLQNAKVRQAMYYATDPTALSKVRKEDPLIVGQLIPPSIPGYNPDVVRPERDVAKAKQLLKEAGYPNGVTIELTHYAPAQATAAEIARQLAEAGITMKLDGQTEAKAMGQKAYGGTADSFFQQYSSDILDGSDVLTFFSDSANCTNDKAIDRIKEAQNTFDSSKRLLYLQEASKELSDYLCAIPFYAIKAAPVSYNSSLVMQRDINSSTVLGVYWSKVYAK